LSARTAIEVGVTNMLAADYHPGTLIQAAWLLARSGLLPLTEAVKLISTNVAAATNLRDRGAIVPGLRADLVLVDASDEMPRVRATLREGHVIYADRHSGLATQRSAVERVRHA
jgi:alpha-D-ribose 1-methylphosphonate 5-triphosphate diphosphatase